MTHMYRIDLWLKEHIEKTFKSVLPGQGSGVGLWIFRSGAAELMQHGLAPVEGGRQESRRGKQQTEKTGKANKNGKTA